MRWYPWLSSHFEHLITSYQTGRAHHALIIQALPGMGEDVLISATASFLICQQPKKIKNCGNCRNCQLMLTGTHPDYYKFELGKNEIIFGVDIIRDLKEKLYEYAILSDVKVVWFKDVKLLTESAVNALLSILEEPPRKTWFFFSYLESWHLLAMLRSRCCLYYLNAPREDLALNWLQQKVTVPQNIMLTALRLCAGAPVAALEILENHWTQRTQLYLILDDTLNNRDWLNLLTILNHEQAYLYLQWIITLLIDALIFQHGATAITNLDFYSLVKKIAKVINRTILHVIIHTLCQCREQLLTSTTINRELILIDKLLIIEYYLQPNTVLPGFHSF